MSVYLPPPLVALFLFGPLNADVYITSDCRATK
jgi:hypothetical protein